MKYINYNGVNYINCAAFVVWYLLSCIEVWLPYCFRYYDDCHFGAGIILF